MLYTVPILTIPLSDKAIGNLFAGFLFQVRREVWEWVWVVGRESHLFFLVGGVMLYISPHSDV